MLSIYAGAGCMGMTVASTTMLAGSRQVVFSVQTATAAAFSLVVLGSPLSSATQNLTVFQLPTQLTFTANPPAPLRAGSCFQATVESRFVMPLAVVNDTAVALATNVANGTRFFSDAMCGSQTTSVTIRAGNSNATVYVKPLSGVPQSLSATAPFATGLLSISPVAIVRRGMCAIIGNMEQCPIEVSSTAMPAPATLGKSFLITQTIAPPTIPAPSVVDIEVRCRTQGTDVSCSRRNATANVLSHFQVVELPVGLTVQAVSSGGSSQTNFPLAPPVDVSKTFILKSIVGNGSNYDQDDSVSVVLSGPTNLTLSSSANQGYDLQAIQWDGVTVTRGQLAMPAIPAFDSITSLVVAPGSGSSILLSQPSTDVTFSGFPVNPCPLMARAEIFAPGELRFSRGLSRALCTSVVGLSRLVWERIDFGPRATVWSHTVPFTNNTQTVMQPIMPVDPTRTFVITSSQQLGGQGSGEMDGTGSMEAADGAVQTRLVSSTQVEVARGAATSAVTVTLYVVQIEP